MKGSFSQGSQPCMLPNEMMKVARVDGSRAEQKHVARTWGKEGRVGLVYLLMVTGSVVCSEGRVTPSVQGTGIGRAAYNRCRSTFFQLAARFGGSQAPSAFVSTIGALRPLDQWKVGHMTSATFMHPAKVARITFGMMQPLIRPSAQLCTMRSQPETKRSQPEILCSPKGAQAKRFLLLRHGQTNFNAEGRVQGSSDTSVLSELGVLQARGAGEFLDSFEFSRVFVSPLVRAAQTLEEVRGVQKKGDKMPQTKVLQDLREIDLYEWQGMLKADIKESFPEEYALWRGRGASKFVLPSGNAPVVQLWSRARNVWQDLLAGNEHPVGSDDTSLVVAHNGIIQAMLCTAIGLNEDFFRTFQVPNGGVLELEWVPGEEVARRWRWLYPEKDPQWRIVSSGEIACSQSTN